MTIHAVFMVLLAMIQQTETLKLLFALYFRILKNPRPSPLLPAALSGISKFAHLVNIDFFKDLLKVLKDLISLESDQFEDSDNEAAQPTSGGLDGVQHRLLCIVTAFELLSGQGKISLLLSSFVSETATSNRRSSEYRPQ